MNFESFIPDILVTLLGGILLTLLFFWAREKLFPLPDITGRWHMEMTTINTSYNTFRNMVLRYVVIIWRDGNQIQGSVEKIYENSSTGEHDYVGKTRTRGVVEGCIEKKYLGKDKLLLHVVENGHGRESTNFYDLIVNSSESMKGVFNSMVANQDGIVLFQREPF